MQTALPNAGGGNALGHVKPHRISVLGSLSAGLTRQYVGLRRTVPMRHRLRAAASRRPTLLNSGRGPLKVIYHLVHYFVKSGALYFLGFCCLGISLAVRLDCRTPAKTQ